MVRRLTEDKNMYKLLSETFRRLLHDVGEQEIKNQNNEKKKSRFRSAKVNALSSSYYLLLIDDRKISNVYIRKIFQPSLRAPKPDQRMIHTTQKQTIQTQKNIVMMVRTKRVKPRRKILKRRPGLKLKYKYQNRAEVRK